MNENEQNILGNIFLSHRAISTIVSHAALQSYGIVGLAPKNLAAGLAAAIVKDSSQGVNVKFDGKNVTIDLYITVEYGTRITSVAHSVADSVKYQVEKMTGLHVESVNIHVKGLRVSSPDK